MAGFSKLVPEIVVSSIWNESSDVRIVWITMIAVKDENGFVRGSPETLSRLANVTLEIVKEALRKFTSPDPNSCTPDNDGRRIEEYPGGWLILNHAKYREREHVIRQQTRERVARFRERKGSVTQRNVTGALPSASASASVSVSGIKGDARGTEARETEGGKSKDKAKRKPAARFVPPTPEEVTAYSAEIGWPMDGAAWCDVYAAKGWLAGKNAMKDWKAAVRNWKRSGWTSCSIRPETKKTRADFFAAEMDG